MTERQFSVLVAVYRGDDAAHVRASLASVFEQTVEPAEVLVVRDGPLTSDLEAVLEEFAERYPERFETIEFAENRGLGAALRRGLEACSHDLVARMDADDVAVADRFERQLAYLEDNPDVDVLSGAIAEFEDDPADVERVRSVPTDPDDVRAYARHRNPVNHPAVMLRRDAVLDAGNYRPLRALQDYELWVRMLEAGYTIANLPSVLVKCRGGDDLYGRRGGLEYARQEVDLQRRFLRTGAISLPRFVANVLLRVPVRLVPGSVRKQVYEHLLRS